MDKQIIDYEILCYDRCRDLIWLESKTGMDPGLRSPNNEFIEYMKES